MTLEKTGLLKRCPRCGRVGEITYNRRRRAFEIEWNGRARGGHGRKQDLDTGLDISDLFSPTFGCGYDPPIAPRR